MTFVAGSSWQPDEDLFIEYFNQHPEVKLIIAPHVIDENHLVEIIRKLKRPYVRYTRANEKNVRKADCLIIDCFGLLSSHLPLWRDCLYRRWFRSGNPQYP